MRLLRYDAPNEFSLAEFFGRDIPKYAILSHTWGADSEEVTFRDFSNGTAHSKLGYEKIKFCGQQAAAHGLQYFWIDTCCIDKSSSTELSEAINSMFKWYKQAVVCFAYLTDVSDNDVDVEGDIAMQNMWNSVVRRSRWFTRGWTLQELLAPMDVQFFSQTGTLIGTKSSRMDELHAITGIDMKALTSESLESYSEEEKMSWARGRITKREEDMAYCLLGIFDIYMPLIYGEGEQNAFARLRREIRDTQSDRPHPNMESRLEDTQTSTTGGVHVVTALGREPVLLGEVPTGNNETQDVPTTRGVTGAPLIAAARAGQLGIVRLLLDRGSNPNAADSIGKTPLLYAAEGGHIDLVSMLLESGADVNARDESGYTALIHLILKDCTDLVKLLLEKRCDVTGSRPSWWSALHSAAKTGNVEIAELLLESDSNLIDKAAVDGVTPIYVAATWGHIRMVELLLSKGCNKDKAVDGGWTTLMKAAETGHIAIVELLLRKGCNKEKASNNRRTALMIAARKGNTAVVKVLLREGCDKEKTANNGSTALIIAAANGRTAVVELLLREGCDKEKATNNGSTALMKAAENGHTAVVELLL